MFYFYTAFTIRTHTSPPPNISVGPAFHTQFHSSRVLFIFHFHITVPSVALDFVTILYITG